MNFPMVTPEVFINVWAFIFAGYGAQMLLVPAHMVESHL